MKFEVRLRELRLQSNLTQKQLGDKLFVHHTTVKDWETKGKQPRFEMLVEIARLFDVSSDYLLGLED